MSLPVAGDDGKVLCPCEHFCRGGKRVRPKTYKEHAIHRPLPTLARFLSTLPPVPPVASTTHSIPSKRKAGSTFPTRAPVPKHPRLALPTTTGSAGPLSPVTNASDNLNAFFDESTAGSQDTVPPSDLDLGLDPDAGQPGGDNEPDQYPQEERNQELSRASSPVQPVEVPPPVLVQPPAVAGARVHSDSYPLSNLVPTHRLSSNLPVYARNIEWSLLFGDGISKATLENSRMSADDIARMRNPVTETPTLASPDDRLSLDIFLAVTDGSERMYKDVCSAVTRRFPDCKLLSHYQVEKRTKDLSGVIHVYDDCCINSCHAFSGFLSDKSYDECQICGERRWDVRDGKLYPRSQSVTILLGPQLAARRLHPDSAHAMNHQARRSAQLVDEFQRTERTTITDINSCDTGRALRKLILSGEIKPTDTILYWSTDGAQLYDSKTSDCWISIWVLLSVSEDLRYLKKHILPSGTIPGPKKPKNLDSFWYTGFHHLSAIQKEGLLVWDASTKTIIRDFPFQAFCGADTPGMATLDGMVGASGHKGCRYQCELPCRHMEGKPRYFPVALKPDNYAVRGSDHPDVDIGRVANIDPVRIEQMHRDNLPIVVRASRQSEYRYEKERLRTGIVKPSILLGLPRSRNLGNPSIFAADMMHLVCLNLTEVLLELLLASKDMYAPDKKEDWKFALFSDPVKFTRNGVQVDNCRNYIPGVCGVVCRNPQKKMNSGYKAKEFQPYVFSYLPAFLEDDTDYPREFWETFCKVVAGLDIMHKRSISLAELQLAFKHLVEFENEFERRFYERKPERLHFVTHAIHQLPHLAPLTEISGPLTLLAQWTMERMIGDLGREIKQPSRPYANLAQRAVRRARVNAICAIYPELGPPAPPTSPLPSVTLEHGYTLLWPKDTAVRGVSARESELLTEAWKAAGGSPPEQTITSVRRWGRLRLPGKAEEDVRTAWKEKQMAWDSYRIARCVRIPRPAVEGRPSFRVAEVRYFARILLHPVRSSPDVVPPSLTVAVVSVFEEPDLDVWRKSHGQVYKSRYRGDTALEAVNPTTFHSIVGMVPYDYTDEMGKAGGYIDGGRYWLFKELGK